MIDSRVDADGVYLSREHMNSLVWGIKNYYALDFARRCLTERGTVEKIDHVVNLDYPGNTFHSSRSRHEFYTAATSFTNGPLSSIREGDWTKRPVFWTLSYPPGVRISEFREERQYLVVYVEIDVESCEPVRIYSSGDFYHIYATRKPFIEEPERWDCVYKPIREEELNGRDNILSRSYNCGIIRGSWWER